MGFLLHFFFLKSYNLTNPAHFFPKMRCAGFCFVSAVLISAVFPLPDVTLLNSSLNYSIGLLYPQLSLFRTKKIKATFSLTKVVFSFFSCFLVTRVQKRLPQNSVWICSNYTHKWKEMLSGEYRSCYVADIKITQLFRTGSDGISH